MIERVRRILKKSRSGQANLSNSDIVDFSTRELIDSIHSFISEKVQKDSVKATDGEPDSLVPVTSDCQLEQDVGGGCTTAGCTYYRFLTYTPYWAISVRGKSGCVECFLLPMTELASFTNSEHLSRLKLQLRIENATCTLDGYEISLDERNAILSGLLKDLVSRSREAARMTALPTHASLAGEGESLSRAVKALVSEKHSLAQKIVTQQEEILGHLARELHDSVIAEIMMLKRSLTGDRPLSEGEMVSVLNRVSELLYDLCEDLTPRDLKDWGLLTVLKGLLERIHERSGLQINFDCANALPSMPDEVELQIYRIIQECLNNVEKHADATSVDVNVEDVAGVLKVSIRDNGKGVGGKVVSSDRSRFGGRGAGILRERAELINCHFPARILVDSKADRGTHVILEICYAAGDSQ